MPNTTSGHSKQLGFSTRAVWAGQEPCEATGATIVPIYQTATYTLPNVGVTKAGFDYSRTNNPTRKALEAQLASLEGARYACAFASGMAACNAALSLLQAGDHIVAPTDLYGGTHRLITKVLSRYGIDVTFVDCTNLRAWADAIRPNTRLFWVETPSNPTLRITDIPALRLVADATAKGKLLIVADNTFATPYFQQPLALGADVVVHSTTKYLAGHSDVVGGVVITNEPALHEQIAFHQNAVGAIPGPWDCYLTIRGAKTLAVRMKAHAENARAVYEFLSKHEDVAEVFYPGFGAIVSFRPRGGVERAHRIAESLQTFALAVSLGGVESLVCFPAKMTHGSLSPEERAARGVTDDLLRLSVGIETTQDLIDDLQAALARSTTTDVCGRSSELMSATLSV